MYRTILLAYDGSQQGREALDQGAKLASLCKARVHLLAVVAHELGVALAEAAAPSDLPEREYQEVRRVLAAGIPLDGASDHGVSEALYLRDPDQNGVELYRDRAEAEWPRDAAGRLAMVTKRLDLNALLAEAA